jgi:signal transduction histidine kinase
MRTEHDEEKIGAVVRGWVPAAFVAIASIVASVDAAPVDSPTPRELVPIASVMAAAILDTGRPVRVRGIVTWRRGNGLIVQDNSAGIWIEVADARRAGYWQSQGDPSPDIREGIEVEIEGWSNQGGYAPNILPETIQILCEKPQPEPRSYKPERFFRGVDDCLRVMARGVVQGFRDDGDRWLLLVVEEGRRFAVAIDKHRLGVSPEDLVDSVIACAGVATAEFNTRGQFLSPRLNVTAAGDLTVEQPSASTAFESPQVALRAIGGYRPQPPDGHRICTRGVVTYAVAGGFLYLQEGCCGLRVETTSHDRYESGDVVDVAGFINSSGYVASLSESVVRKVSSGAVPPPLPIQPVTIAQINALASQRFTVARPGDYYGCLIRFPARVIDIQQANRGGEVLLIAGDTGVVAVAEPLVFPELRGLESGSEVMVTGIVIPEPEFDNEAMGQWRFTKDKRIQILLRSAEDIVVVKAPSWWKPHRLLAALAGVAALAAVAAGWIVLLQRQVGRQLALIESQLQAKAAMEERQRIALEFHDTLEQDLAGVALRMDAAAGRVQDSRARAEFEQQRALLVNLRAETRDFLWDLQEPERSDGSLQKSLASQAAYQNSLMSVPIMVSEEGDIPDRVPSLLQYHLLRTAREAVANAGKHADPTRIDVRLCGGAEGLTLQVIDDGIGFDVAARGAISGHFGLRGMRERARRMGATLVIESGHGTGTTVSIRVPPEILRSGPQASHDPRVAARDRDRMEQI